MVWKQMFNQFKVKLRSQVTNQVVAFDVTPEITETRTVTYKTLEPVHMPGGIHVFANTASRVFNINNIRLVSRSREEASKNLYRLNILRSWTMPYFGVNNTSKLVGAPPDVLSLTAYATGERDHANANSAVQGSTDLLDIDDVPSRERSRPTNIHNIPVVLQQLSIPYPSDVDYIDTVKLQPFHDGTVIEGGVPFPVIMTLDMVLMETHSPQEFAQFDLKKYKQGLLETF